jgi:hypothetical protein
MNPMSGPALRKIAIAILVLSAGFFLVRVIPYANRPTAGFMAGYFAARMLLTHQPMSKLYDANFFEEFSRAGSGLPHGEIYTVNTPVLPFLFLPLALLPMDEAKLLWEVISLVCLLAALALLYRHLGLTPLERIVMSALAFAFTPVYLNFVWGQLYVFLLLLHAGLLFFWSRGLIVGASASIALMLALKGYGVFFLLVALLRKEWLLLGCTIVIFMLVAGLSSLAVGYDTWIAYASQVGHFLSAIPASATYQQTVGSFFSWFLVRDEWHSHPWLELPGLVRPLMACFLAAGILLLVRAVRACGRGGLDLPFATGMILSVVTAPLLFDYHYVLLLIPLLICYKSLSGSLQAGGVAAFGAALLLLVPKIPYYDPMFQNSWLGIAGFPRLYGALVLLWIMFLTGRRDPATAVEAPLRMEPAAL